MLVKRLLPLALGVICLMPTIAHSADSKRQEIRFYKANKQLQTDRIWFTKKKSKQAGCHNFLKAARVYKLVLLGYDYCEIYTQKDCQADSLVGATRKKGTISAKKLTEGYAWLPISEHKKGEKLRSWQCFEK